MLLPGPGARAGFPEVFLAAVASIHDLGAIVVIALFHTDDRSLPMLFAAGAGAKTSGFEGSSGCRIL
jgi:NhaA family Na+:H+ antiporter